MTGKTLCLDVTLAHDSDLGKKYLGFGPFDDRRSWAIPVPRTLTGQALLAALKENA